MRTFPFIQFLSTILIPCLLLFSVGCYSYQTQKEIKDLRRSEEIIVVTPNGLSYRLSIWWTDAEGNLTGTGKVYRSEGDALSDDGAERFQGTLLAQDMTSVQVERISALRTVALISLISGAFLLLLFAVGMSGIQK